MFIFLLCFYSMVVQEVLGAAGLDYGNRTARKVRNGRARGMAKKRGQEQHHVFGGSMKPHNANHAQIVKNLVAAHGGNADAVTHEEKDLANMAAHRNMGALSRLHASGMISSDTARAVAATAPVDARPDTLVVQDQDDGSSSSVDVVDRMDVVHNLVPPAPAGPKPSKPRIPAGTATGRTNAEQGKIQDLEQDEKAIDNGHPGTSFSALMLYGHTGAVARGIADEIRNAVVRKTSRLKKAWNMSQPAKSPLYVTEAMLAGMANSKDAVSDKVKLPFVKGVFEDYLAATKSPQRAEFEAKQANLLIDEYNMGLAAGLPPSVSYTRAIDAVDQNYQQTARAAAIEGGGQMLAQHAADKIEIENASALEMANSAPGLRSDVLRRKIQAAHDRKMSRTRDLNNDLVEMHVKEPIIRAHQKLQQAAALKDAASMEGAMNPVVQEKILADVAAASAEDTAKAMENLERAKAEGPSIRKTSALNLLSKANVEKKIAETNEANEERQREALKIQQETQENNEVRNVEEQLAKEKENLIIRNAGENAFEKVLESTGDVVQANLARESAERVAKSRLNSAREERKSQVMNMIGPIGANSMSVQEAAEHIATAHAGLNAVGDSMKDLREKHEEELKHLQATEALLRETATTNLEVKKVIPPTTSQISISNGKMKLPLKGFSGEEATTEQEALVQSRQKIRRNQVRNRVVGADIESGLNVVETKEGFTHISEAAQDLLINKGLVFYPENAKGLMDKQKIDTKSLVHRFNTGERPELEKGVGYYEADASGFMLHLPSPSDPIPPSAMTSGDKALNIEHAADIYIEDGDLVQTPWNDFVKQVRPTINGIQLHEDEVAAASEMKTRAENEKKIRNLAGITTEVYTNPDGSKFVEVSPPYGVPELMTMDQAVENLNSVGPTAVSAVSEESKKQNPDVPLDMAATAPDKGSEEGFISSVMSGVERTGRNADSVATENTFNGMKGEGAAMAEEAAKTKIQQSMTSSKTVEGSVRNSIISKALGYAKTLGISVDNFLNMVSKIPESSIKEMVSFNGAPETSRKNITDTAFFKIISSALPSGVVTAISVAEIIFNNISTVTHVPNMVGGEILEKFTVPNLKSIAQVETKKTPTGTVQTSVSVPNIPGTTQVLGQVKMKDDVVPTFPGSNKVPQKPKQPQPLRSFGSNVPTSPSNPLRPEAAAPSSAPKPVPRPRRPGAADHTINEKSYSFDDVPSPAKAPLVAPPVHPISGFTGKVAGG